MADTPEDGGSFLSRWSRRKRDVSAEEAAEAEETGPADEAADAVDAEADEQAEENRIAAEAVDIDRLTFQDDFRVFMQRGVPAAVRQKALRKLWVTDPVLANLDGLNDFEEDFNAPEMKGYKSDWNVARGFLSEDEVRKQLGVSVAADSGEEAAEDEQAEPAEVQSVFAPQAGEREAVAEVTTEEEMAAELDLVSGEEMAEDAVAQETAESAEDDEPDEPVRVPIRQRWNI